MARLTVDKKVLADFCRRHGIRKLSLFGSVLREDFSPQSDVDVLVEFQDGRRVGYLGLSAMEREMSDLLGRKADLRTPAELSRYFRQEVLETSAVLHTQE